MLFKTWVVIYLAINQILSLLVGRLRACCDLVGEYLPAEIRDALVNSYE